MATPITSFYLTNGQKLVDIYPLESNGVNNQSIPNEIFDIDYSGTGTVYIAGDISARLISLVGTSFGSVNPVTIRCVASEFDMLVAQGLQPGMYVDVPPLVTETASPLPNRTQITEVNTTARTISLSNSLTSSLSNRSVKFSYPFEIIDLDPTTPSPYIGVYGAYRATFDGRVTAIQLAPSTPLQAAIFDVTKVITGSYGSWVVQGIANAREVFYVNSVITVADNTLPAANTTYTVSAVQQSSSYHITDVVKTASHTVLTITGDVSQYFIENNQLVISNNTSHDIGAYKLNGTHNIAHVQAYNASSNSTDITISTVISGVSGAANGMVAPALPVAVLTVNSTIPNGTIADGTVTASAPIQLPFAAPPAITPIGSNKFIVSWRVTAPNQTTQPDLYARHPSGDWSDVYSPGHSITVKNNNYYMFNRLVIDSVNVTGTAPNLITEIRTTITDPSGTTPVIGTSGSLVYPSPAVPYGHIQYRVEKPATPLQLIGRGVTHYNTTTTWGRALQNNSIHMLENFAHDTPPVAPLEGQLWFDTTATAPSLKIKHDTPTSEWNSIVVSGMPVQDDIDMNNHSITNMADATNPGDAVNLRTADQRYVNAIGDTMTGVLVMSSNKITYVADTDIPAGRTIDTSQVNGQDALNMRTADARYVNVTGDTLSGDLHMGGFKITHTANPSSSQDVATKSYVDSLTSGIVWLQPIKDPSLFDDTLSAPPVTSDGDLLYYRSYYVKPTQYPINGVNDALNIWSVAGDRRSVILPGHKILVKDNLTAAANGTYTVVSTALNGSDTRITVAEALPNTAAIGGFIYHAGGSWNNKNGRIMAWSGTNWVDVLERPVAVGDRFGVFFEVDNDDNTGNMPGGSFAAGGGIGSATKSAAGKIVTVNAINSDFSINWGNTAGSAYPVHTPAEPDAVSVVGSESPHYGHSYTFRGQWGTGNYNVDYKWIEFAGPSMLVDGAGLKYSGNVLNVGAGTGISVSSNAVNINPTYFNANYMRRDGSTTFTAAISMDNNRLIMLSDPSAQQDAVNLRHLQNNYMNKDGSTLPTGNMNLNSFRIINLADPTAPQDAASKAYADLKVARAGDTMTGTLMMSSASGTAQINMGVTNRIVNLADPIALRDAVNLQTADGRYVRKAGDTMTGPMTLNADPTQLMHAATKKYVDDQVTAAVQGVQAVAIDGGTF